MNSLGIRYLLYENWPSVKVVEVISAYLSKEETAWSLL